jgi:alpha-L-fucosidase
MSSEVDWSRFKRNVPEWFTQAKFGIFIHWGAYSVPAWAEPIGELGTIADETWFAHNPYAEWYFNTIKIPGSPAAQYHKEFHNDAPYDAFLDQWKAENFNPGKWAALFNFAGAQYVVPTTKHHDGIALWDAPGTGERNTVSRGPKRNLIEDIAESVRKEGMHFGVYYSGGLDWSITNFPPHQTGWEVHNVRPNDAAYSMYAYEHVRDLIDKYKPEVIFNDIEWPNFSKREGEYSLASLFDYYYEQVPTGVVNDRWGVPHSDYKTSEYKQNLHHEEGVWENNRGVGYSFGYNQLENDEHHFTLQTLLHHFLDIVSRGGNFLLNVGPTATGEIPERQERVLNDLGKWMKVNSSAIYATQPISGLLPSQDPWIRWTTKGDQIFALIEGVGQINFSAPSNLIQDSSAKVLGGGSISVQRSGESISLSLPESDMPIQVVQFLKQK